MKTVNPMMDRNIVNDKSKFLTNSSFMSGEIPNHSCRTKKIYLQIELLTKKSPNITYHLDSFHKEERN